MFVAALRRLTVGSSTFNVGAEVVGVEDEAQRGLSVLAGRAVAENAAPPPLFEYGAQRLFQLLGPRDAFIGKVNRFPSPRPVD